MSTIHLDFSPSADVFWHWSAQHKAWLRFHGTVPHMLEGGVQVSATNVVVMHVVMKDTGLTVFTLRTDRVKPDLRTWKDFFDFLPHATDLNVNFFESPSEIIGVRSVSGSRSA